MSIPNFVDNDEELGRNIFIPIHLGKNNKIKHGAFRPKPGASEVSVQRMNYCTLEMSHEIGKGLIKNSPSLIYAGIALVKTKIVRDSEAKVISSPIIDEQGNLINESHADIKYDYVFEKGIAPPPKILLILNKIANSSSFIPYEE